MPRIWRRGDPLIPKGAVYIGRGSKYGNRFPITAQHDRNKVCDMYEEEKLADPEFITMVKQELYGKDLVCYCAPLRCHGDFLIRIAN
ncbi:MAG: DUF4326 domain-containing protein [Candidatus Peribacteraceae bacterium]|nr:DUF4326 domain-containing protein [Candidatus Peribacteraceae bacterium]